MMKKIIMLLTLLTLFVSIAYGNEQSKRHEDYYFDTVYLASYLADGLNSSDIAIDGAVANNGDFLSDHGWSNGGGQQSYSNNFASLGSVSVRMQGQEGCIRMNNKTWRGEFGMKHLETHASTVTGVKFYDFSSNQFNIKISEGQNSTHWVTNHYLLGNPIPCVNEIPFSQGNWTSIVINHSANLTLDVYINGTFCHSFNMTGGVNRICPHESVGSNPAYYDEFYITWNGTFPLQDELPPADNTPPSIITNLTNNTEYNTPIDFNVTINETGSCAVNDSGWVIGQDDGINFTFIDSGVSDGNYSIEISCNDSALNNAFVIYNFEKASPYVSIEYPPNGILWENQLFNTTFLFDNFEPNECSLFINLTETFIEVDNITTGEVNLTEYYNDTIEYLNLTGVLNYWNFEEGNGTNLEDLASGNNATLSGVSFTSSKGGNNTGNFSGEFVPSDYASAPYQSYYSFGTDIDYSMSVWFRSDHASDGDYHMIVDNRDAGSDGFFFGITSSDTLQVTCNDVSMESINTITDALWHHAVFVYDRDNAGFSDIWLDNVSEGVGISTSTKNIAVGSDMFIGRRSFSAGINWEGDLDNIILFNRTLSSDEIGVLYQEGLLRFNITLVENITTVNETLNQSINYTLEYDFGSVMVSDYDYYLSCFEGIYVNSSTNTVYIDNDFISPDLNMIFPNATQTEKAYDFDLWLNFTTDEYSTCVINNTAFIPVSVNGTYFIYRETTLNNSMYHISINCTDLSIHNNSANITINITKDKLFPVITFINPNSDNTSDIENDGDMTLLVNITEDRDLLIFDFNITYFDTELFQIVNLYNDSVNLSGQQFLYSNVIDTSVFPNGTVLKISSIACDSHTNKKLKKVKSIDNDDSSVTVTFKDKTFIKVRTKENNAKSTKLIRKIDRFNYDFDYKTESSLRSYEIITNGDISYLGDDRGYKGHFIIYGKNNLPQYWLDFEGENDITIDRGDDGVYTVTSYGNSYNDSFRSIGELNCVNKDVLFSMSEVVTEEDFNISGFDLDEQSNVLILILVGILWVILLIASFYFKDLWLSSITFFLGIVLGFLFSGVHIFMTLLFVLMNIGIFIKNGSKFNG